MPAEPPEDEPTAAPPPGPPPPSPDRPTEGASWPPCGPRAGLDPLTRLPHRGELARRLDRLEDDRAAVVLVVDLDDFRAVNPASSATPGG